MDSALFTNSLVQSSRIIYTPSMFARANLLYLQEIGSLKAISPHTSGRSDLSSYLFFIVLEGAGELTYNGTLYQLSAGDCVFINCKNPYSQSSSEELWTLKWCHFYGSNLAGIYNKYVERGGYPAFHAQNPQAYVRLLDELYTCADSDAYTRDMRIYDKLSTLTALLMEESWHQDAGTSASSRRNVLEIKDYIDANYREKLTLEGLAGLFFINKHYLARCFKEQCGSSVAVYIQQVRITHAKSLLRFSEDTIEKIAEECGIPDANYFARVFKKVEGITPGEYRKLWKGKQRFDQ
ncbi:MAG: AraC family transcriptional regulator [Lachnospiraceae bacterium]|nr:AraC family transcriptional regulator [Lachnospiraceae bacterium]